MKYTIFKMEQASIEFKKSHTVNLSPLPKDGGNGTKLTLEYLNDKIDTGLKAVNDKIDKGLKDVNDKIDKGLKAVNDKIDKLTTTIEQLTIEMRKGFAQINARIDNLVVKNNLKE